MAAPATPQNVYLQQGNNQVYLSWDISAGATSYTVQRSTDGVSFSTIASPSVTNYLDLATTSGVQFYYQVASINGSGTSPFSSPQAIIPVPTGKMSLAQIRLLAQQRADRVNSNFVTLPEWNTYINQSALELYDLLVTEYEDYFIQSPNVQFQTDGVNAEYDLPADFYKLSGVDLGLTTTNNAKITVKKFDFIERNRFVFPQITAGYLGVFNLRYRILGNKLMFIPTPSAGQWITLWYVPRLPWLLKDTDILDGVSGWTEYVVVDAAIKALRKEESDTQELQLEKSMLLKRIEDSAMNRDIGQPDTISPTRRMSGIGNGNSWGPEGDGSSGGF